jgi:hypothetical protein
MLFFKLFHVHEPAANTDSQGPVSDGSHYKSSANNVFRVVNADDRHTKFMLTDIFFQKFVYRICVDNCLIGKSFRETCVVV